MDLREDTSGDVSILEIKGRIDSTTAPVLGEKLTASLTTPQCRLVLDLRQLVAREGGVSAAATLDILGLSLLALGAGAVLQRSREVRLGRGSCVLRSISRMAHASR